MRTLLFAFAALTTLAAVPASAQMAGSGGVQQTPGLILVQNGNNRGGSDYGPMGQSSTPACVAMAEAPMRVPMHARHIGSAW